MWPAGRAPRTPPPPTRSCWPVSPAWRRARSRWRSVSTSRWRRRPSSRRPRSRASGTRSTHRPEAELAELTQMYVDKGLDPTWPPWWPPSSRRTRSAPSTCTCVRSSGSTPPTCRRRGPQRSRRSWPSVWARSSRCCPTCWERARCCRRLAVTLVALFGVGVLVSRVTVRSWWSAGLRQMLLGGAAAAATFLFGQLVGGQLG